MCIYVSSVGCKSYVDAARQFLSASHPADKYKVSWSPHPVSLAHVHASQFFLRGTQLSQLSEEYDTCLDNINQTKKVLHQKKQVLPDLRATFKEASVRFEEASKAREQRFKVDELKKELAWAHVAAKQTVGTNFINIFLNEPINIF
jgi:hypothetical protein